MFQHLRISKKSNFLKFELLFSLINLKHEFLKRENVLKNKFDEQPMFIIYLLIYNFSNFSKKFSRVLLIGSELISKFFISTCSEPPRIEHRSDTQSIEFRRNWSLIEQLLTQHFFNL